MHIKNESLIRRAARLALLLGLSLIGCEDLDPSALDDVRGEGAQPSHGNKARNEVLVYNIYMVEGDEFTYVAGSQQSHPLGPHGSSVTPRIVTPDGLPRATASLSVQHNRGRVVLYWDGVPVEELAFDMAFFLSGEVGVLSYQAADGSRAELHIYGKPDWVEVPNQVSTRAEIEALEAS